MYLFHRFFVCVLVFNTFDMEAVMNDYESRVLISFHKSGKKSGLWETFDIPCDGVPC